MSKQSVFFDVDDYNSRSWWDDINHDNLPTAIGEPRNKFVAPEVRVLHRNLVLAVCEPTDQWQYFVEHLTPGSVLVLYPAPAFALRDYESAPKVVAVQPDAWLAGWLADWFEHTRGGV